MKSDYDIHCITKLNKGIKIIITPYYNMFENFEFCSWKHFGNFQYEYTIQHGYFNTNFTTFFKMVEGNIWAFQIGNKCNYSLYFLMQLKQ